MVDAMNAVTQYAKNVEKQELEIEVCKAGNCGGCIHCVEMESDKDKLIEFENSKSNEVIEWMTEKGFIVWLGDSFIMQKWVDNNEPYDRMAIPYQKALEFYTHRDDKEELKKAVAEHKLAVKEAKGAN